MANPTSTKHLFTIAVTVLALNFSCLPIFKKEKLKIKDVKS